MLLPLIILVVFLMDDKGSAAVQLSKFKPRTLDESLWKPGHTHHVAFDLKASQMGPGGGVRFGFHPPEFIPRPKGKNRLGHPPQKNWLAGLRPARNLLNKDCTFSVLLPGIELSNPS